MPDSQHVVDQWFSQCRQIFPPGIQLHEVRQVIVQAFVILLPFQPGRFTDIRVYQILFLIATLNARDST